MLGRRCKAGCDEQRADLVAVQSGGVGLIVESRSANMRARRPLKQALLLGVPVEARHRAQAARHRRSGSPTRLEVAGEALDVGAAHREQSQVVLLAPGDELAKIQGVRFSGQASVASQERR